MSESGDNNSNPSSRVKQINAALFDSSGGKLTAVATSNEGVYVQSNQPLKKGELLVSCRASGMALEQERWSTHCACCASLAKEISSDSEGDIELCSKCKIVGLCPSCSQHKVDKHSPLECQALAVLFELLFPTPKEGRKIHETAEPINLADISSHILTIRLLCQEWRQLPLEALYASPISALDSFYIPSIVETLQESISSSFFANGVDVASSPFSVQVYKAVLGRVLGCSHAVTDISLPLGKQWLGRAVFWHASFFNHECAPNAFLSCRTACNVKYTVEQQQEDDVHARDLDAEVHFLGECSANDLPISISLSYIPTSGLSRTERLQRLEQSYGFSCNCRACTADVSSPWYVDLPEDSDPNSVREVQFSCYERLLCVENAQTARKKQIVSGEDIEESNADEDDEIDGAISMVQMTQRGIQNQSIGPTHEVSMEAHRLLAMGYSLYNASRQAMLEKALEHHDQFIQQASKLGLLFDPVALATQRLEYRKDCKELLKLYGNDVKDHAIEKRLAKTKKIGVEQRQLAMAQLHCAVGQNHPWKLWLDNEESKW